MSILNKDTTTISVGDMLNGMWIEEIWVGCRSEGRCMAYYHAVDQHGTKLILSHDEVVALLKGKLEAVV